MPAEEVPFRRILMPTDGSDAAGAALPAVAEIAREFGAEVLALNVAAPTAPLGSGFGTAPLTPADAPEKVAGALSAKLADLKIRTSATGASGDPAEKILETAASTGADLIAMATHGRTGLARLGLGSVTERVLREATVPMLVVRTAAAIPAVLPEAVSV